MKKGRINKFGSLEIWRPRTKEYIKAFCATRLNGDDAIFCRDSCPLFGDPVTSGEFIYLELCHGRRLEFENFCYTDKYGKSRAIDD